MIIEPSNYTYETMPDYEDAVDGAVEIPVTCLLYTSPSPRDS